ncbi:hypothetical protein MMC20_002679 [Loxospora ochrophaea]|nr:hypothetical protein [Loxospora ochrophaea]
MKGSAVFGWRSLASKIHPPLPLNPRESNKLLLMLKDSFRQRLAQRHPEPTSDESAAVNHHFQSILGNPIFSQQDYRHGAAKQSLTVVGREKENAQSLMKQPMDHFCSQVAAGTATLQTAAYCLDTEFKNTTAKDVTHMLRRSKAASTILEWLWSSRQEESLTFLTSVTLTRTLSNILAADDREARIWEWIRLLQRFTNEVSPDHRHEYGPIRRAQGIIFKDMIASIFKYGRGINHAVDVFLAAMPKKPAPPATSKVWMPHLIHPAGAYLMDILTQSTTIPGLDTDKFSCFEHTVDLWSVTPRYHNALLPLYHPTKPDASAAVADYMPFLDSQNLTKNWRMRLRVISLFLKAVEVLHSQGQRASALRVMEFIKRKYPEDIGLRPSKFISRSLTPSQTKDEEKTLALQQLESLAAL